MIRSIMSSTRICALIAILLLVGCGSETQLDLNNIPTLPPHWSNVTERGTDTRVGHFASQTLTMTIHYDIGELAGLYADTKPYPEYKWIKSGRLHGSSFRYLLNNDNMLYVTFPDEGPANFWAKINDDSEIDYVLELLARYRNQLLGS